MKLRLAAALAASCLLLATGTVFAQGHANPEVPTHQGDRYFGKKDKKNKKKDAKTRTVTGFVRDPGNKNVAGAVVRLKDLKTLEVRSFITLDDGAFRFYGLSTDADYELKATHDGMASRVRRLTVYDSRKKVNLNLKLKPKSKG